MTPRRKKPANGLSSAARAAGRMCAIDFGADDDDEDDEEDEPPPAAAEAPKASGAAAAGGGGAAAALPSVSLPGGLAVGAAPRYEWQVRGGRRLGAKGGGHAAPAPVHPPPLLRTLSQRHGTARARILSCRCRASRSCPRRCPPLSRTAT